MTSKINQYRELICKSIKEKNVPGISISFVDNGKISWTEAFGIRCVYSKQPVTINTVFEGASFTKPIVAYIFLKLCDKNLLELDIPLYKYLREPYLKGQPLYELITARHVLSHCSGFPNWRGSNELKVEFEPGEKFQYSGEGFVYLQKVIEEITQKNLNDLANEYVFKPFNMNNSSLIWLNRFSDNIACRHDKSGEFSEIRKINKANAAFSLYCTAEDYAKFLIEMMNINKHLSFGMISEFYTEQTTLAPYAHWGLGWGIELNSEKLCWHWGDNGGFKSFTCFTPESKKGIVILTNGFYGLSVCQDIMNKQYGESKCFNDLIRLLYS